MDQRKILPLESLRGVAAIIVALLHFQPAPFLKNIPIIGNGDLMVDFFFVLTVFVIGLSYWGKINSVNDLIRFQKKRFWRLYPLHLVTLLIFLIIEIARYLSQLNIQPAFERSGLIAFISHTFLVQSFTGHISAFNTPSWSISTEFYTYLVFALVMLIKTRLTIIIFLIGISFAFLMAITPEHPLDGPHFTAFSRCAYSFFLGVMAFRFSCLISAKVPTILAAVLLIASTAAICLLGKSPLEICIPILFAITITALSQIDPKAWLPKILSIPILVWTGTISYSIYMTHGIAWFLVGNVMRVVSETSVVNGVRVFHLKEWEAVSLTFLSVVLMIMIAHLSHKFIEARYRGLGSGVSQRNRT